MSPSLWISLGGLVVSIAAFWRAGRVRVLDLRTNVRKEIADLRVTLDELLLQIPHRVQSRMNASSAIGSALSGAMVEFRSAADGHITEIKQLRVWLNDLEAIPMLATYGALEEKAIEAHTIRRRTQQLVDKYASAAREDDATRELVRKAALDRVNRQQGS